MFMASAGRAITIKRPMPKTASIAVRPGSDLKDCQARLDFSTLLASHIGLAEAL